jgi:hypothetical protein
MPVEVEWHLLYRVIGERFWGKVEMSDIELHIDRCVQLLTEAQHTQPENRVHLLADGLEVESMFPLYQAVAQGVRPMRFKNRGILFLITNNNTHQAIVEVTARIGRFPMHAYSDRQAALDAVATQLASEDQLHHRASQRRD